MSREIVIEEHTNDKGVKYTLEMFCGDTFNVFYIYEHRITDAGFPAQMAVKSLTVHHDGDIELADDTSPGLNMFYDFLRL